MITPTPGTASPALESIGPQGGLDGSKELGDQWAIEVDLVAQHANEDDGKFRLAPILFVLNPRSMVMNTSILPVAAARRALSSRVLHPDRGTVVTS